MNQLKLVKSALARLGRETAKLEKRKKTLEQQELMANIKRTGIRVGSTYKAIPIENSGDVLVGKVRSIRPSRWDNGRIQVLMLVPANGRFRERTVYIDLERYELEKVKTR